MPTGVYQRKPLLPEHRMRISAALKNRIFSDEHRRNITIALTGKKRSEESRRKQSERQKGRPSPKKGRKLSSELCARMSLAQLGKTIPDSVREKIRQTHIRLNSVARLRAGLAALGLTSGNQGKVGVFSHSEATRRQISETMKRQGMRPPPLKRELHYNWKGGITPVNLTIRNSLQYKQWRTSVFQRDDYTCVLCAARGCKLHADHINPFSTHPALRFELSNGRTLCVPCHLKTDTWGTKALRHRPQQPTEQAA